MKKILLVEDDPFLIEIYTTKFKQAGFIVDVVENGEQCLKRVSEDKPDVLILDIVLPDMDGWGVLKEIKKNSQFKDMKVIILSNLGEKGEIEKGINLGAVRYFVKAHYAPSEIVEEVKKIL